MARAQRIGLPTLIVISGALLGSGCDDKKPAAPVTASATVSATAAAAPKLAVPTLDAAQLKKAEALKGQVKNAAFPYKEQRNAENAKLFVYLAGTAEEPAVVAAALKGMAATFSASSRAKNKTLVDDHYRAVTAAKIGDANAAVQASAIRASGHAISGDKPDTKLLAKLVELATSHPKPEGRYAALEQIYKAKGIEKDATMMKPFLAALDAKEPFLISGALFRVKSKASRSSIKADLEKKVIELIKHEDPGIRGRSAEVLSALAGFDKKKKTKAAALILPLLGDDNAFTKSAAASALAWIKYKPAVHEIIKMVDDTTKNTYDITGWKTLEGHAGRIHHDGSAWSRVGDAALYALKMLSASTKERFDYKIDRKKVDADLKKAAAAAKTWYAKVKADVPLEG